MTTKIIGTGSYVPEHIVTNDDLAKIVETNDEWVRSRTGIHERRIAIAETTPQMAAEAARRAIKNAGIDPADIDVIVVGTSSAAHSFPSDACAVQAEVGAVNAVAFDISAACTGFVFALSIVHAYIKSGVYKTGLIIGAECLSKITDWTDRGTCILFGDGAGAAVVTAGETGLIDISIQSDGTKGSVLSCVSRTNGNFLTGTTPEFGYTSMDGQEVFKFAVKRVPESIAGLAARNHIELDDIKYYVLHQANYRIFESIAKRLKAPVEKFPSNIDRYGNTSAASIPLMLDEMNQAGMLKTGDKLVFSGFGGGLTWGSALLEW